MSLSALLLAKKTKDVVDNDLDTLFKSSAGPSIDTRLVVHTKAVSSAKTSKPTKDATPAKRKHSGSSSSLPKKARLVDSEESQGNKKEDTSEEEDNDDDDEEVVSEDEENEHSDDEIPIHESLKKEKKKGKATSIKKYIPEDETRTQRDARTIFVGNVPVQVVASKSLQKQLKRHILSFVLEAKIESLRFRSVPFKNPTTKLEDDEGNSKSKKRLEVESPSAKQARQAQRAADWRNNSTKDDEGDLQEKTYLTAQQKRKLAYIKGDLNEQATAVHAYVVFAHPIPKNLLSANVPHKEVLDPLEAAKQAVQKCDGSVFMEHTLRVDVVRPDSSMNIALGSNANSLENVARTMSDPKLSVFVGNLDFASKEEDVRVFFETLLREERGPPSEDANGSGAGLEKRWVTRVRVVRDKDTQLGKGFAYVQFADRDCVDEILALEENKLKFAKRKLRVQKCKSTPTARTNSTGNNSPSKSQSSDRRNRDSHDQKMPRRPAVIEIPKGDSSLGEKLAGLPKDVRKQLKSTDADRVARRLAKKKARHALEKAGVTGSSDKKIRQRERKKGAQRTVNTGRKESKGRVRSDKSLAKRNTKKQ